MKLPLILSIIVLLIVSLGLSGTESQAGEIDDLKKRLLFLQSQKEIVKKLDGMQSNIDGLRGKVDGFQKELDDFRVQYDLKSSKGIKTTAPSKAPKSSTGGVVSVKDFNWIMNSISKSGKIDNGNGQPFKIYKSKDGNWKVQHQRNWVESPIVSLGGKKLKMDDFPGNWWMNGTWIFSMEDNDCQLMHEDTENKMKWKCG